VLARFRATQPPIPSKPISDTGQADLLTIDLTDNERYFVWWAQGHWGGCAGDAPLPIDVLGCTSQDEFDALTDHLVAAVKQATR
jgi:hypothetical protein